MNQITITWNKETGEYDTETDGIKGPSFNNPTDAAKQAIADLNNGAVKRGWGEVEPGNEQKGTTIGALAPTGMAPGGGGIINHNGIPLPCEV